MEGEEKFVFWGERGGNSGGGSGRGGFFVGAVVDFVDAVERDTDVLKGVEEGHEAVDGAVELADDILHGEHGAERDAAVDYGCGGEHGDEYVFDFVDEDAAGFLGLLHFQRAHLHFEEVGLHIFPFVAAAVFAVLQFDFLHGGDELEGFVLVGCLTLEKFVVEHFAATEECGHPQAVGHAAGDEDGEDEGIVDEEHHAEDGETEQREGDAEGLLGEERLHARVVGHALQQVAGELGVEEAHGEFEELDEEVADERDVDAHGDVEQQPAADEVGGCAANDDHQLAEEHKPDEADVFVADADVDNPLREKGHEQLEDAP